MWVKRRAWAAGRRASARWPLRSTIELRSTCEIRSLSWTTATKATAWEVTAKCTGPCEEVTLSEESDLLIIDWQRAGRLPLLFQLWSSPRGNKDTTAVLNQAILLRAEQGKRRQSQPRATTSILTRLVALPLTPHTPPTHSRRAESKRWHLDQSILRLPFLRDPPQVPRPSLRAPPLLVLSSLPSLPSTARLQQASPTVLPSPGDEGWTLQRPTRTRSSARKARRQRTTRLREGTGAAA